MLLFSLEWYWCFSSTLSLLRLLYRETVWFTKGIYILRALWYPVLDRLNIAAGFSFQIVTL